MCIGTFDLEFMWDPSLAESDTVTFFAVLPVSWLPGDKKDLEIFEFSPADYHTFPLLYNSRESKRGFLPVL